MTNASTSEIPPVVLDKLCVAYNSHTGDIFHFHRVITLEGGEISTDDSIKAVALYHATSAFKVSESPRSLRTTALETVFADPQQIQLGVIYKIDLNTYKLIAVPREKQT